MRRDARAHRNDRTHGRRRRSGWTLAVLAGALLGAAAAPEPPPVPAPGSGPGPGSGPSGPAVPGVPSQVPSGPAAEVPRIARNWPVGVRPSVLRGWEPPPSAYGRGHRGVDLAAGAGAEVRSVAAGRVSFAGRVAGRGVVSVELTGTGDPPLRTTFQPVSPEVRRGDAVGAGAVLGGLGAGDHCGGAVCLHWGLRRGPAYLDPLTLLPFHLLTPLPPRLLPVPPGLPLPQRWP
ncbi:M23 family metallopeptidase [Streptomyces fragilis]|uniref:M23 family metallopeptidase n=2 Tax=Streptomyces fragilis TaxID=67301 RepID=A0ABV2YH94_9ACTN|nr:M23 family metallopeptidase [Streptomyces fragilis]